MTEKKTFKNPAFVSGFTYSETPRWSVYQTVNDSEGVEFSHNEWDMEVTFTKKDVPIPVGSRVQTRYSKTYTYIVLGQWKNDVIVVDPDDDQIEFFDHKDLVIV